MERWSEVPLGLDPGSQRISALPCLPYPALAAPRPEAELGRLRRFDHGVSCQIGGADQSRVIAKVGEHQPGFLDPVERQPDFLCGLGLGARHDQPPRHNRGSASHVAVAAK